MKIIGITGRARCGKDTLAAALVEDHGFVRISLAEPLRQFVSDITGLTMEELTDGALKEQPLDWLGGKSPRQLMQTLGTEWGRNLIDRDIWLKVAARKVREARQAGAPGVVIPDVRFDNEAELVSGLGGWVLELTREGAAEVSAHSSELGIDDDLIDETFSNDGPLFTLRRLAEDLALDAGI